jgi:hypothetical protein
MAWPAAAARRHTIDTGRAAVADAAMLRFFAYWQNSRLSAHSGAKAAETRAMAMDFGRLR